MNDLAKEKVHCVVLLKDQFLAHNEQWFESDIEGPYGVCLREAQQLNGFDFKIVEAK